MLGTADLVECLLCFVFDFFFSNVSLLHNTTIPVPVHPEITCEFTWCMTFHCQNVSQVSAQSFTGQKLKHKCSVESLIIPRVNTLCLTPGGE